MIKFRQKRIVTVKSIGEDLRRTRRKFNLSIVAVERKLGIGSMYLRALENNDWEVLPGEIYAKNFLKKYVIFLGLSWPDIKLRYEKEIDGNGIWQGQRKRTSGVSRVKLISFPKVIKSVSLAVAVLAVVFYLGVQLWLLIRPPRLEFLYPADNFQTQGNMIKVLGKVEKEATVKLNDNEMAVGKNGFFKVDIVLNKGLNIIKLEAEKRYGRKTVIYRRIVME